MDERQPAVQTDTRGVPNFELEEPSPQVLATIDPPTSASRSWNEPPSRPAPPQLVISNERIIVRTSEAVDQVYAAFAEAQAMDGYGDVEKTKTARVTSRKGEGSSFTYDYETLADVIKATRPFLAKAGLVVIQFPYVGRDSITIRTRVAHKSGQWFENDLVAAIPMPDPQAVGSGITYLRRYAQKSILNVAADDEDDDGNAATGNRPAAPPQPARRVSEQPRPQAAAPQPAAQSSASPVPVGKIVELDPQNGAVVVKLDTGYRCVTRDESFIAVLKRAREDDRRVEILCKASSDPAKFLPIIVEIASQR